MAMLKRIRFDFKLVFVYLLTSVAIFAVSTLLIGDSIREVTVETTSAGTLKMLKQISVFGDTELKLLEYMLYSVGNNREVLLLADSIPKLTGADQIFKMRALREMITGFFSFSHSMLSTVFYFEDGNSFYVNNIPGPSMNLIKNHPWYQEAVLHKGTVYTVNYHNGLTTTPASASYFSMAISPRKNYLNHSVELIYCIFSADMFRSLYSSITPDQGSEIVILDRYGKQFTISNSLQRYGDYAEMLWQSERLAGSSGVFLDDSNGEKLIVIYSKNTSNQWSYVNVGSYENLDAEVTKNLSVFTLLHMALFGVAATFVVHRILSMTKPLTALTKHMTQVVIGDKNSLIHIEGSKEIGMLGESFNSMIERIDRLIEELKEANTQKLKAEISALQAQINPHFLLNTLNSIKLMLILSGTKRDERIVHMLTAFMNMLDGTLSNADTMISVNQELQFLKSYIYILQIRFDKFFDVTFDVDPEIGQQKIPKFLLQPILENAFNHGVYRIEDGSIHIAAHFSEEYMLFTIQDNGAGMSQERADQLIRDAEINAENFSHIGMANVVQRIRLNYGKQYGIKIESAVGVGTIVTLRIPKQKGGDEA